MDEITVAANGFVFDALADGPADGELVVLLHGFPESMHEWTDVVPPLAAAGFRVVAPNQRGYSAGARPDGVDAYHVTQLATDVLAIADAFSVDEQAPPTFHLVGHDWGALVAWYVAAHHPDRLHSLSIVSVPHPKPFADARASDPDQQQRSSYIAGFREPGAEQFFLADDAALLRAVFAEVRPELADAHARVLGDPRAMAAALSYYRAWDDALDELGPVSVPTLFVWSTDDVALGRVAAERTKDFVAAPYRFEVLDGLSHWIPEVAPEPLARLVIEQIAAR